MSYFIISCSEDGDVRVSEYTREQVEAMLNSPEPGYLVRDFVDKVPHRDISYWGGMAIIIKGEIVIPKVKEVVTKVTLEGT